MNAKSSHRFFECILMNSGSKIGHQQQCVDGLRMISMQYELTRKEKVRFSRADSGGGTGDDAEVK